MRTLTKSFQVLGILLAGGASFYGAMTWLRPALVEPELIVEPSQRQSFATANAAKSTPRDIPAAQRDLALVLPQSNRTVPDSGGNAFATQSWLPPPPVVKAAPPPPPSKPEVPVAPPLPYVYLGLIERINAKPQAFLGKGEALLPVVAGDALEGIYRVESLNAQQVVITHLPTNTVQTLTAPGNPK